MTDKLTDEELHIIRDNLHPMHRPHYALLCRLLDEHAELKAENANHQETLSGIRYIARYITRETGDVSRIILWVDDALSGYTETREQTMAELKDKLAAAEKERDELRAKLEKARKWEEYASKRLALLDALEAAGVDNWEGYSEAAGIDEDEDGWS